MPIEIMDFKRRFQRGIGSSPFTTFGLEWCSRCRMEVDCDTRAHHEGTLYVYKRWCLRCGKVLKRGIYDNVPLLSSRPLPAAALEWTTEPGKDRR
jgi:hypothetical protein